METVGKLRSSKKKYDWNKVTPPFPRDGTGLSPFDNFWKEIAKNLPEEVIVEVIKKAVIRYDIVSFDDDKASRWLSTAADWLKNFARVYNRSLNLIFHSKNGKSP